MVEGPGGLLLVCNRRRDGSLDWSPPGGVIEPGEPELEGLQREVGEETGLAVHAWSAPLYSVRITAPQLGWTLDASVYRALEWSGDLQVDDPDGVVVDADFVPAPRCAACLALGHPWVGEPLTEWLAERWHDTRRFAYHVQGTTTRAAEVQRVSVS